MYPNVLKFLCHKISWSEIKMNTGSLFQDRAAFLFINVTSYTDLVSSN